MIINFTKYNMLVNIIINICSKCKTVRTLFKYILIHQLVICLYSYAIYYLQSSFIITTVAWAGSAVEALTGKEDELMVSRNVSLCSSVSSSLTETLNCMLVIPAGNVTAYGPDI